MLNKEKKHLKSTIINKAQYTDKKEEYLREKEKCFTKKGEEFFNNLEDFKYINSKAQYTLFELYYNKEKKRYFSQERKPEDIYLREKLEFLNLKEKYLNAKEYYLVVKQNYYKDYEDIFVPTKQYLDVRAKFNEERIKFFVSDKKHINNVTMNKLLNSNSIAENQPKTELKESYSVTNLSPLSNEDDNKWGNVVLGHLKNNGYGNSNGRMFFYPEVDNNFNEVATTKQTSAKTLNR